MGLAGWVFHNKKKTLVIFCSYNLADHKLKKYSRWMVSCGKCDKLVKFGKGYHDVIETLSVPWSKMSLSCCCLQMNCYLSSAHPFCPYFSLGIMVLWRSWMKTEPALEDIVAIEIDNTLWWIAALLFYDFAQDIMAVMVIFGCFSPLFTVSTTTKSTCKVNNVSSEICFQQPTFWHPSHY